MLDLGKYAFEILLCYGIGLSLIGGLIVASILRQRNIRAQLQSFSQTKKGSK